MVTKRQCAFCAGEIEPGRGTLYVKRDGSTYYFCSGTCRKHQMRYHRVGHQWKWTRAHELKVEQARGTHTAAGARPKGAAPGKGPVKRPTGAAPAAPKAAPAAPAKPATPAPAKSPAAKPSTPAPSSSTPAAAPAKKPAPKKEGSSTS